MKYPRLGPSLVVAAAAMMSVVSHAETPATLEGLIAGYLQEHGAAVQLAPDHQLARRYAIDLTGVVPTLAEIDAMAGKSPQEMFSYFSAKAAMPHTAGERPYVWVNLLQDADHFLFSNSTQFSRVAHIVELRDQLRRVYAEGWSYRDFARWALESQMFLNRFPSASDRATASFFLFLERDILAPELSVGNMWNGYALTDPDIPPAQAETNPLYHAYDYDPSRCAGTGVMCDGTLWSASGSTPKEAIELIVTSPVFAEATVDRYWRRYLGYGLPGVEFPEARRVLAEGFVASGFDVNWLIRAITTSPAYTQEMMFR